MAGFEYDDKATESVVTNALGTNHLGLQGPQLAPLGLKGPVFPTPNTAPSAPAPAVAQRMAETNRAVSDFMASRPQPVQEPMVGYNPNDGMVFSGGKVFNVDNATVMDHAAKGGFLDLNNASAPAGFELVPVSRVKQYVDSIRGTETFAGELGRGAKRGVDQLQGLGYAGAGLVGDLTGLNAVRDWGLAGYERNNEEAFQNAARVGTYKDVGGFTDAAHYVAGGLGEAAPQLAAGFGAAGIGAKVGTSLLGTAASQAARTAAATRGATIGGMAYGTAIEPASIYGEIYEKTGEHAPGTALAYGIPAGLLEGWSEGVLFRGLMKGGIPAGGSRLGHAAKQAGQQFAIEGVGEELPQTFLEQSALRSIDPSIPYNTDEMIDATIKGGLGGGVTGGVVGLLTPRQQTNLNTGQPTDLLDQQPEVTAPSGLLTYNPHRQMVSYQDGSVGYVDRPQDWNLQTVLANAAPMQQPVQATLQPEASAPAPVVQQAPQPVAEQAPPMFKAKKANAAWTAAVAELGEDHPALEGINQALASSKYKQAEKQLALAVQERDTPPTTELRPTLTAKQQPVFDFINQAVAEDRASDVIDSQGVIQYQKIADALGMARGSAKSFINGVAKAIAKSQGITVEEMKAALKARVNAERGTETATQDRLGMSPAEQESVVDATELFGSPESGTEQHMGVIESVGGSQSEIGPNEQPHDYVDSVEPSENIKAHAEMERQLAAVALPEKQTLLQQLQSRIPNIQPVDIDDAATDYDADLQAGDAPFAQLPEEAQAQWVKVWVAYEEKKLNAQTLARVFGDIADANRPQGTDGVPAAGQADHQGRAVAEGQVVEGVSQRLQGEGAGASEEAVVQPEGSGSASEEVSAQGIIDRWNTGAKALEVAPYDQLTDEQQNYLQGSGTWAEFDEAAGEILDEINGGTQFSEQSILGNSRDVGAGLLPNTRTVRHEIVDAGAVVGHVSVEQAQDGTVTAIYAIEVVPGLRGRGVGSKVVRAFLKPGVPLYIEGITDAKARQYWRNRGVQIEGTRGTVTLETFKAPAERSADEAAPRDSEAERGRDGSTAEKVAATLKKLFFSPQKFDQLVTVVQTARDLKPAQYALLSQAQDPSRIAGVTHNGKVILIAGNIQPGQELAVLLHEVGVHLGMAKLIGKANMERLSAQIETWAKQDGDSQEVELAKDAVRRAGTSSSEDKREELIAYFIEGAVNAGIDPTAVQKMRDGALKNWFRTLWAAAKAALRQIGFSRFDDLTAQNLVDLAYGAAELEFRNGGEGATTEPRFSEATERMQDKAFVLKTNLKDLMKRGLYETAFGHDLAKLVEKYLPQAKKFFDIKGEQSATLTHLEAQVDTILEGAHSAKDKDALNAFLNDSTRSGLWGFKPEWNKDAVVDPEMEERFRALSKESQAAAKAIFKYGYDNVSTLNALVKKELTEGYETEGLSAAEIKKLERKKLRTLGLFDKTFKAMQGPYAPLVRIGNYVAVAKSQEYIDAVATGDDARVAELQEDPDHYIVEFYETLGEAQLRAKNWAATGNYAKGDNAPAGFAKEHYYNKGSETPWDALKRVRSMLETEIDEADSAPARKTARNMRNMLNDLYFQTLAEGSARQFQNKRRKIAGENKDMLRAFAIKGRADAHFIAHLQHSEDLGTAISEMRAAPGKASSEDRADVVRALNAVLGRQAASLEYRQQPMLAKLQGVTSFWMLVTNPAYYLQNATQPFMMTLPWLAGKYGYGRSASAFFKAYQDLAGGKLDIDKMPINKAEKDMLQTLKDDGILDIGINRELGYWENSDNKGLNVVANVQHFFGRKVQQLEMVNRISTALAAYRLSGNKIDAAKDAIRTTHGDYSQFNEPGFFSKVPAARLLLQFRKFQIIQLSMFARLIHSSFKGDATEKAAARKSLAFLLGHTSVMAGALGFPAMNLIGPLIAAALGEPGDPDDEEYLLRKAIGDKALADLLLRGAPAALGVNMSQRLGMQNMTALAPFASKDLTTKEGFQERVLALLGPWAGLGSQFADGIGQVAKGETYKGMELMVPSGVRNLLRAFRQATEGVSMRNNDMVLSPEEVSFATTLFQTLGLPTTQLSDRQRVQGLLIETEKAFTDKASELRKDYATAYKKRDAEAMAEARESWKVLQDAQTRNGFKPAALSSLLKAPMEQTKRERGVVEGVETTKRNKQFVANASSM